MKNRLFLLLPVLLLSSCGRGQKIQYEEAVDLFQNKIHNSEILVEKIKERKTLRIECESIRGDESSTATSAINIEFDYSFSERYFHFLRIADRDEESKYESWAFVKDDKTYFATIQGNSKTYKEYTIHSIELTGRDFDDAIAVSAIGMYLPYFHFDEYFYGFKENAEYYTSGEGNLTVTYKAKTKNQGYYQKYNAYLKINNYFVKEETMTYSSDGWLDPTTGKIQEGKRFNKETIKTSNRIKTNFPDLSQFERTY